MAAELGRDVDPRLLHQRGALAGGQSEGDPGFPGVHLSSRLSGPSSGCAPSHRRSGPSACSTTTSSPSPKSSSRAWTTSTDSCNPNPAATACCRSSSSDCSSVGRASRPLGIAIRFAVSRGPLNMASFLMGTTEFLTEMKVNPDKIHRLLRLITDFTVDWLAYQRECFPTIDGVLLLDDIVGFIGEEDYREFAQPYLKELFTRLDVSVRFFHNDSPCKASAPHLHDTGINLYNMGIDVGADATSRTGRTARSPSWATSRRGMSWPSARRRSGTRRRRAVPFLGRYPPHPVLVRRRHAAERPDRKHPCLRCESACPDSQLNHLPSDHPKAVVSGRRSRIRASSGGDWQATQPLSTRTR